MHLNLLGGRVGFGDYVCVGPMRTSSAPSSPVQTSPVPSELGGELGARVVQSGHELVLTEGTNLRRRLINRDKAEPPSMTSL